VSEATWLEGVVLGALWRSNDDSWAVLRVKVGDQPPVLVVGSPGPLVDLLDDEPFASFEGKYEDHPTYGHRFKAEAVLIGSPRTRSGLQLYLASSGAGIGPLVAGRIVGHFGDDTLRVLDQEPERLTEVTGVGEKRAKAIAEAWSKDASGRALSILLRGLGLSPARIRRILNRYGDRAFDVVTRHPYQLAETIYGIGFQTADAIARGQGLPRDAPERVAAAIVHVVKRAQDDGHVYVPVSELNERLRALDVPTDGLDAALAEVMAEGRLVEDVFGDELAVAHPVLEEAEAEISMGLLARRREEEDVGIDVAIADAERLEGIALDETQRAAVRLSATTGVSVITGGPGTGKTTLVRVLLRVAKERGELWELASPTGRAAKRLAESTGQEAATLHRLLGFQPDTGSFAKGPLDPIDADGLVIDEVSMVDTELMAAVVRALPLERRFRLVLVGDADQLPSVGPGQVLRDILRSQAVPSCRLTVVHRQAARSGIRVGAGRIREGAVPTSGQHADYDDLFLIPREDPRAVLDTVRTVVTQRLAAKGFDPTDDVQVLCPMRRGPLGVEAIGEALRDAIQGDAPRVKIGGRVFAVGDKVLCTRNRYDLGVFNGDLGRIESLSRTELSIRFDDTVVEWPREDASQIELAYAMTVHKSQGSEYPAVVLVLHRGHGIMLRRHLFYTAVTRAKRFLCIIGSPRAWETAARRVDGVQRRTRLCERLQAG
jgi:exodeoxyribonuclease V alpha subunit